MARAIALGADICYSARAMMLSVGCIQALLCNNNTCPVGIATQNASLMNGLVVDDKAPRAANFHEETIHSFLEMIAASGLDSPQDIKRKHINKRVGISKVIKYDEMYPEMQVGCLLSQATIPDEYKPYFDEVQVTAAV